MAAVLLAACSDDSNELVPDTPEQAEEEKGLAIGLSASAPDFVDAAEAGSMARENLLGAPVMQTRSWVPPSGYFLYSELYDSHGNIYENFAAADLSQRSIDAFFTRDKANEPEYASSGSDYYKTKDYYPYHGRLRYMSSINKWRLSIRKVDPAVVPAGAYYVYGFIPGDAADDATLVKLSGDDYKNGAKLTIKGLRTAGYDACVIIGAKEGPDIDTDNGLVAGDFKFMLNTTIVAPAEDPENYLYLLFDHLCSALSISIKVDGTYNLLRTIKLKQLTIQTATELGLMKEKADVEVDLVANTAGINPITSLNYEPVGNGAPVYQSDDGLTLTTDYKSFLSHFLPISGVTKIVITCTYDIYDKKGNLIRKDSKATNTVRLSDIIAYFPGVERGWKYGINMTVVPTYLYMLSEPDLENPRMVVN